MVKFLAKCITVAALCVATTTPALADWDGPNYYRSCDASACYVYWNTGDGNWILIAVEPKGRGGLPDVN